MKTLLLLRHAKSSWGNAYEADHDRPLNKRGQADAPRMGRLLRQEDLVPDLIVSSTARRAAQTAVAFGLGAGYEEEIAYTRELYHADPEDYFAVANTLDSDPAALMMVAHNPGISELVEVLSGHYEVMPTAAVAAFRLPIADWTEWDEETPSELLSVWRPKELI